MRPGEDLRRDPASGLDARFGAGVANGAHGLDQGAEVGLGGLVPRSGFGPGGDHHALADVRQLLPERLGDERHERVQETDGALHGVGERLRDSLSLRGGATLPHLGRLDVPVAELGPDELANRLARLAVLMRLHQAVGVLDGGVEAAEDPAVGQGELAAGTRGAVVAHDDLRLADRPQREAGRVPELVGEVAGVLDLLDVEAQIVPGPLWVTRAKRRASAPYSAVMAVGSITLPLVLLIFAPSTSRTVPCR